MAFYSVRVDDEGKEIETTRQTFRKLHLDSLESSTVRKSSSQDIRQSTTTTANRSNYKTVRYVNSATFIEKDLKNTKKLSLSEEEDQDVVNSSDSFDLSDDIMDQQYQTHIVQDCEAVPLLELNSNESFPSSNNMTYSYRKVCEVTKMIQKPDAYKEWLDAKKAAKVYERKLGEEKKKNEEDKKKQRKILAEKKFQEWLVNKTKSSKCEREQPKLQTETIKDIKAVKKITISDVEQKEREKNFEAWLKKKVQQEKSQKEKLNEELKRERELEKKRREEAADIYRGWLKSAPQKPKPVPLNKGILTLKGSVSDIFINPMPWVALENSESTSSI